MVELTRRQAIEDVASELFREHGYAGTSIRDIARALSVQGASLYAHVTSKEDVLWAIVDRAATRFEAAADAAEADAAARRPGDPAEVLAALVRAHVDVLTADVDAAGVFVHEWRALAPEHRQSILARRDAYEARFRRTDRGRNCGGRLRDDRPGRRHEHPAERAQRHRRRGTTPPAACRPTASPTTSSSCRCAWSRTRDDGRGGGRVGRSLVGGLGRA